MSTLESRWREIDSPCGRLVLELDETSRLRVFWQDDVETYPIGREDSSLLPGLVEDLKQYFAGQTVRFGSVPTPEGPDFFRRCWDACRAISPGTTISYAELARRAGSNPRASRAAGQAMRRNPLPVIVPCHRVICSSGGLGGYAGHTDPAGRSLRRKKQLLDLELRSVDSPTSELPLFVATADVALARDRAHMIGPRAGGSPI